MELIKTKRVLILGGAGFIGLELAKKLSENKNYSILIVDNFSRGKKDLYFEEILSRDNISFKSLDLTNPESFLSINKNYDYLYMLASVVGVGYTNEIPDRLLYINTSIILNVCEWLKTANVKRVLFSSTSENYVGSIEEFNYSVPTDEDVPLSISDIKNSRFTYAATKILGESFFINYSRVHKFDSVIIRYHNVYGPRMGFKHVIPQVVQRILDNENPLRIFNGNHTRAFNYIDDAVNGTILTLEKGASQQIYHIGDSESEITIEELTKYISNLLGYKGEYEHINDNSGSVSRRAPDTTKAKEELGYIPKDGWKYGVKKTVLWYKEFLANNKPFE